MAKKNIVKLTESKLQEMIIEAVKQSLNENVFTDMGNAIGNTWNNVRQKFDDEMDNMERGYDIQNGRPQSFDEVIKGNGWKIHARKPSEDNSEMYYIISMVMGLDGEEHGLKTQQLIEDLNIMAEDLGLTPSCRCIGKNKRLHKIACPMVS